MDMDSGFCSRSGTPNIHISKNLTSRCSEEGIKLEETSMDSDSPVSSILTDDLPLLKSSCLGDSSSEASSTTTTTSTTKRDYNKSFTNDGYKTNQENNYFRRYHNHYNYGHQPRYHNNHFNNGHYNRHYNRRHFQGQHNEFYHHSNNYSNFHPNQHQQMVHGGMPISMSNSIPSSGQQLNPLSNPEMDENLHPSILAARKAAPWPNSSGDHLPIGLQGPANNKPFYTQQSNNSGDTANSINFGSDISTNCNPRCGDIQGTTTTANSTTNGTTVNLELHNSCSNNMTQAKYPQKFNHDNQFHFKKLPNFSYGTLPRFQNNFRNYSGNKNGFNSGPNANNTKHSPAFSRNKKPYNIHQVPFDASDIDPDERVKNFKFGEVTEKPTALIQHNEWDALSEAIWEKFATNQQTTETFKKKMELWREVMDVVSKMPVKEPRDTRDFLRYGLQVVGSTMSGFGSNTSDVDICMLMRKFEVDQRFEAVDRLSETLHSFRTASLVGRAEIIYAKVPILKFRDANKGLEVDLNCNNFVGIRNTQLLYCYSQLDWRVKPLVLVVKLWAQLQGINDAKNMTVSSYSLVLMVIHYLQCGCSKPVLPCLQNMYPDKFNPNNDVMRIRINDTVSKWESQSTESLAELLVGFLEYYSHKFDYSRNALSVRLGSTIPIKTCMHSRSPKNDPHQWKYLCVEEPFDLTNTARSVYDKDAFDKIRGVFYTSWQRILISRDLESIFVSIPENEARAIAARLR